MKDINADCWRFISRMTRIFSYLFIGILCVALAIAFLFEPQSYPIKFFFFYHTVEYSQSPLYTYYAGLTGLVTFCIVLAHSTLEFRKHDLFMYPDRLGGRTCFVLSLFIGTILIIISEFGNDPTGRYSSNVKTVVGMVFISYVLWSLLLNFFILTLFEIRTFRRILKTRGKHH